ncbi:hypothetical protein HE1_00683 [Holospora elegans E1]|uniref:Uncharacterized protein n=1 Tax=Holospora elegans E1 TaxID=1427503 RepID=A0A023DY17_9PROT|nr:hypothetical protein [Holospora elegans]GAJ46351.1 hypothetical protein HE1_00683 [Holospora elegans E1]
MVTLNKKFMQIFIMLLSSVYSEEGNGIGNGFAIDANQEKTAVLNHSVPADCDSTIIDSQEESFQAIINNCSESFLLEDQEENKIFEREELGKGTKSVWRFSPLPSIIDPINLIIKQCKKSFLDLIQDARDNNVSLKETDGTQAIGIREKEDKSVRFICPFTQEGIKTAVNLIDIDRPSVYNLETSLIEFHATMKKILQKAGLYPKNTPSTTVVVKKFEDEEMFSSLSEKEKEFLSTIGLQLRKEFNIFKTLKNNQEGWENIEMQLRLVTGPSRYQPPHIDGNTICVASFAVKDVYEAYGKEKLFLPNKNTFLWFGDKANDLSSKIKEQLTQCGVDFSSVQELPHGVDYNPEDEDSKNAVTLLVMWGFSKRSASYCFFPKPVENFQKPISGQE